ncbi:hypothetical protein MMC13_005805 [Lambiella insularis]|nr:hypothetical protein [Lambiella insularis]
MAIRGQRFHVDLTSDDEESDARTPAQRAVSAPALPFIRDITERSDVASDTVPSPPKLKASLHGFPVHKKRTTPSAFKQQRATSTTSDTRTSSSKAQDAQIPRSISNHSNAETTGPSSTRGKEAVARSDRQLIDEENKQRLAQMSPEEIERERAEVMAGMSSTLIEQLLKRANIDEGRTDTIDPLNLSPREVLPSPPVGRAATCKTVPMKNVTFDARAIDQIRSDPSQTGPGFDPDAVPLEPSDHHHPPSLPSSPPPLPSIHFPHPPEAPYLDPSDPDFLENLHAKYFPEFPVDPSKLAWMLPLPTEGSPADHDSPYDPSQDTLPVSSIRFDFRGRLIPPRLARQLPVTKGLHHHGHAPEAAGYTVPELAHLARSSIPAQRCIAYQTLGRILYRLGRGDFGDEADELYLGLWKALEQGRVLDTLTAEANKVDGVGHRSCKVMATEALWLWQKGGGKKWTAQ